MADGGVSPAHGRLGVLEPLFERVLTFDSEEYHESEGSPWEDARTLARVCTHWRQAVVHIGRAFVCVQTVRAIRVKHNRLVNVHRYFDQYFPTRTPVKFYDENADEVRAWKPCVNLVPCGHIACVNTRLRLMHAHVRDLERVVAPWDRSTTVLCVGRASQLPSTS